VPSLRGWLTRKQKETRRGRAELLLADRAAVWNARPENRQLPSLWQWLQIRWHSRKKTWTPPQRQMMAKAGRFHALRGLAALVLLALVTWGAHEAHGRLQAHVLRRELLGADTDKVPAIVQEMAPYRPWLDPLLHEAQEQARENNDRDKLLRTSLALLPVDDAQVDYLSGRLLDAAPAEVPVIRDALEPHKEQLLAKLWGAVESPPRGKEAQRLRAAAGLARLDPDSPRWARAAGPLADDLVSVPAVYLATWMGAFRPVRDKLLVPLRVVFRDGKRAATERSLASDLLADYAADQPRVLADLLLDADAKQFAVLYPRFKDQGEAALPMLTAEIGRTVPVEMPSSDERRDKLAKRQANAAVALLRLGQGEKVWPLLRHPAQPQPEAYGFSDPRLRSYLIHRLGPLGADPGALVKRLEVEKDVSIRRALLLSLGEFGPTQLTLAERKRLLPKVVALYQDDADAGLHAAAEWLLRHWGQQETIGQFEQAWVKDRARRKKREEQIRGALARGKGLGSAEWYVNVQPVPL
jgi:hypothetical protein